MKRCPQTGECYFCTDSITFVPESIVKGYETMMLTLPVKGCLCPYHLQIVPYDHVGSFADAEKDVQQELLDVKEEIKKAFSTLKKVPMYSEISVGMHHTHIDVFPIPEDMRKTAIKYAMNAINNALDEDRENPIIKLHGQPKVGSGVKYLHMEVDGEGILQVFDGTAIDNTFVRKIVVGLCGIKSEKAYTCKNELTDLGAESVRVSSLFKEKEVIAKDSDEVL